MHKRVLAIMTGMVLLTASMVWAQAAPVAATGQTTSYATGDDGDYEKGVASPSPRFTDNGDGTVTDNLTGLMWAKDANDNGTMTWADAIDYANDLSLGNAGCGGAHTDWRLPNVRELQSLVDYGNYNPALPTGHPFTGVVNDTYWSSTTFSGFSDVAWAVSPGLGYVYGYSKAYNYYVWPVRSDN